MCGCVLNGLTALALCEEVDAWLFVDMGCKRGQQLGSVLEERVPLDVLLTISKMNDLVLRVAPGMALHSTQTLRAECQLKGVVTVAFVEGLRSSATDFSVTHASASSEGVDSTPSVSR